MKTCLRWLHALHTVLNRIRHAYSGSMRLTAILLLVSVALSGAPAWAASITLENRTGRDVLVFDFRADDESYRPVATIAADKDVTEAAEPGTVFCIWLGDGEFLEPYTTTAADTQTVRFDATSTIVDQCPISDAALPSNVFPDTDSPEYASQRGGLNTRPAATPTPGPEPAPVPMPTPGSIRGTSNALPSTFRAMPVALAGDAPVVAPQAPGSGAKINLATNAAAVYSTRLVDPFTVGTPDLTASANALQYIQDRDGNTVPVLAETGQLIGTDNRIHFIGRWLGGGSNSRVHASQSNPQTVKKYVSLYSPGRTLEYMAQTITDQMGGRAILEDIKLANPNLPYRVARRFERPLLISATEYKASPVVVYYYVLTREENIAREVVVTDPALIKSKVKSKLVTNAWERIQTRAPGLDGKKSLSVEEELTVNLVLRELNALGVY